MTSVSLADATCQIGGYDRDPDPYFVDRERKLNITDRALKGVAFIGIRKGGVFLPRATCFFIRISQGGFQFGHLVTAEHVVSGLLTKGHDLWLRLNTKDGGTAEHKLDPTQFYYHPDTEREPTDVAVYPITTSLGELDADQLDVAFMSLDGEKGFLPSETFKKRYMGRGGEIAIIGLFRSHHGRNRNIPIVRAGHIAALPEEPVFTRQGYMEAYLVEAQSIAGLSGSPVLAMPDAGIEVGNFIGGSKEEMIFGVALIGLVHGHFDVPNLNEDVVTDADSPKDSVHTGIGVVIPVTKIVETVNHPELVTMRGKIIEELKRTKGATPDLLSDDADGAPPATDANPTHREDFNRLLGAAVRNKPDEPSGH